MKAPRSGLRAFRTQNSCPLSLGSEFITSHTSMYLFVQQRGDSLMSWCLIAVSLLGH